MRKRTSGGGSGTSGERGGSRCSQNSSKRGTGSPGFWRSSRGRRASFKEGLVLNRDAVDEALRGLDCREIPAAGRSFDPRTMRAVEAAKAGEGKPGTVVEVIRAGWLAGNEVLRPVEVRAVPEEVKAAPPSIEEDEE